MNSTAKKAPAPTRVKDADDEWESGKLGRDGRYVRVTSADVEKAIDDSLGLQMVSLRLPKVTVAKLKECAADEGIGYQPYIRQLLMKHLRSRAAKSAR